MIYDYLGRDTPITGGPHRTDSRTLDHVILSDNGWAIARMPDRELRRFAEISLRARAELTRREALDR